MSSWHGGKGSKPRPVDNRKKFDDNWDRIFKKKVDSPDGFWYHVCKHNGGTHTEKGSHCNWCGIDEEGNLD
jgi:hypothetical protein